MSDTPYNNAREGSNNGHCLLQCEIMMVQSVSKMETFEHHQIYKGHNKAVCTRTWTTTTHPLCRGTVNTSLHTNTPSEEVLNGRI